MDLHARERLLGSVVARLVLFRFRQDAKKSGITSGHPTPEGKPARKKEQPGDQTVEQVEGADSSHTNEEEQRTFHSEVREGLVQALVDSVCTPICSVCLHLCPSRKRWLRVIVLGWFRFPRARSARWWQERRCQCPQLHRREFFSRRAPRVRTDSRQPQSRSGWRPWRP